MIRLFVLSIIAITISWAIASWGYTLHEVGLRAAFLEFDYLQSMPLYTLKHWTAFKEVFPIALVLFLILEIYVVISELLPLNRKPKLGTSRFAKYFDIKKANLFNNKGLWLGYAYRKILRLPGFESVLVVAPTGGGKTTNLAIPNVLTFDGSIVVNDLKGEIYDTCHTALENKGFECYQIAPFDSKSLHGYNPLAIVRRDLDYIFDDLVLIAECLMPDTTGESSFWTNNSQMLFVAMALYVIEVEPLEKQNIATIYRMAHTLDIVEWLKDAHQRTLVKNENFGFITIDLIQSFHETAKNILSGFRAALKSFSSPSLRKVTSRHDFDFNALRKKKIFISIKIKPIKGNLKKRIINLIWSQLLHIQTEENKPTGNPIFLLLEEFGNLGKIDQLETGLSYFRSYNIRAMIIVQYMAQIRKTYGLEGESEFSSAKAKVVYTLSDDKDAKRFSDMLGKETIQVKNSQTQSGSRGSGTSSSQSWQTRDLLSPSEIMRLKRNKAILILEGCYPIMMSKRPWYEISFFRKMIF